MRKEKVMIKKFEKLISMLLTFSLLLGLIAIPKVSFADEPNDHIVISQVYGGGGNKGATYQSDFIELYNPTDSTVNLNGWSVQYASKTGTSWNPTELSGPIKSGKYYLIKLKTKETGEVLPSAEITGTQDLSSSGGKVALVSDTNAIEGKSDKNVVDFVGYGSANEYEGSGTATGMSSTKSVARTNGIDTNDNTSDFSSITPNPRSGLEEGSTKVAKPTADIGSGYVTTGSTVTLSTITEGAVIEHNTIAEDYVTWTTGASTVINNDVTLYVRGVKEGMTTSDVAEFNYKVIKNNPISLSEVKELSDGTKGILTKGIVTYINNSKVYIQDSTGAIMLYMNAASQNLSVGDAILVIGERTTYKGLIELKDVDENRMTFLSDNNTLNPVVYTINDLKKPVEGKVNGYETMCEKVTIKNATLVDSEILKQGEETIQIYPKIDLSDFSNISFGDKVDVTAVVGYYNSPQLTITEMIKSDDANTLSLFATPDSSSVVSNSTIILSTNHSDAKIYYTIDGTEPTIASTLYSSEIPISGAIGDIVTIKAFATKDGLDDTDVIDFTYKIKEEDPLTPEEAKALDEGTENVRVKGIISYINGKDVYIQDTNAAIALRLISDATALKVGDEIVALGKRSYYGGIIQLTGVAETEVEVISNDNIFPDIGEVSIAQILETPEGKTVGYNHMCEVLNLKGLLLKDKDTLTQNGSSIGIYPSVDLETNKLSDGDYVDVRVRVNAYHENIQVQVLDIEKGSDPDAPVTLKEALSYEDGTDVVVQGQISYFSTSYGNPVLQEEVDGEMYSLYVFGGAPDGAKIGDVVKMKGKFKLYNGLPELTSVISSEIVGTEIPIPAKEMTIQEIKENGLNNLGRFVKIKDVTLGAYKGSGSTTYTDATGSITSYKAPAYPTLIEQGDVVDLYAMISCYNKSIQLNIGTKEDNGFNVFDVINDNKAPLLTLKDSYLDAKSSQDYAITVGAEDNKDIKSVIVSYVIGDKTVDNKLMEFDEDLDLYKFVVPGTEIVSTAENIVFTFTATDVSNLVSQKNVTVKIDNKPQIVEVSPANNSNIGVNNSPVIRVTLNNSGDNPVVKVTMKKDEVPIFTDSLMEVKEKNVLYEYGTSELEDGLYTVRVVVTRVDDNVSNEKVWTFTIGEQKFKPYFGQLHAHTAEYSDGSGKLSDALDYFKNIPEDDNVDFISITDHSNYFDTKSDANPAAALNDKTLMTSESLSKWDAYNSEIDEFNAENSGLSQGLAGFEMTWSGGPGHINTFNSDGLVSRNNTILNSKSGDAGLKEYYETLILDTDPLANLSQFNHPGKTFGTFSDFAYWTPSYDNKMVAVEVGNGEGAIGSGGYFPSYAEYTMALDKGWHVAPTNNQDNHKGKWGNANTARTVIITDQLTEEGLLKGLKNMSVYATEDNNLEIQYNLNNHQMGTIISEVPTQPLQFSVKVNDPDSDDVIEKVEIISNGGRVVKRDLFSSNSVDWAFELPSLQGYYYVRVTEADKNMAVTAPIWIGQAPLVGISSFETATKLPVTDESLDFETTLFNNEEDPVTVKSIQYKSGDEVLETATINQIIETTDTFTHGFSYTPTESKEMEISAVAVVEVNGQDKTFDKKLDLYVRDPEKLTYVGIDASHYNEYVNGNYKDSMGNFANMAVKSDVRVVELDTSEELLDATQDERYKMIILTPPTRRNGNSFLIDYKSYTDEEIKAIKDFLEKGNTVIVTGWGDYYEGYNKYSDGTPYVLPKEQQMSVQQNKLLKALKSNLRISDDEIKDDTNNGGQPQRLYLTEYNMENEFVKNVSPKKQVYSNYGGATVYTVDDKGMPSEIISDSISPMVYSFDTSYSVDEDEDGTTGVDGVLVPKYDNKYMVAASEKVTYENGNEGTIIVAGAAFMSNFEIQTELDNYTTPEYSNYTILEAIVNYVNHVEITSIAEVQNSEEGVRFAIEGIVTSNASGFDKETAFFDCIYLQDDTAGINAFPVSGDVRAGQTVRIKGVTNSYNGERQISVSSIEIIDDTIKDLPKPISLTTVEAAEGLNLGSLVKVTGNIVKIEKNNDVVETIMVKDDSGKECLIFIDGYITKNKDIPHLAVGNKLTVVGLSSISTEGPRIRVRDRDDIICKVVSSSSSSKSSSDDRRDSVESETKPDKIATETVKTDKGVVVKVKMKKGVPATFDNKVLDNIKNAEANGEKAVVDVVAEGAPGDNRVAVLISNRAMKDISNDTNADVNIDAGIGSIIFPNNALKYISKVASSEDISISIQAIKSTELDAAKREIVGKRPVYDFKISAGNKQIKTFGSNKLKISLPYTLNPGEKEESVVVYYLDESSELHIIRGNYNSNEKVVEFTTEHFSSFMIGYNEKTFVDVKSSSWYSNAVSFIAARDITSGTTATTFTPNAKITRGQFIVMAMKAFDIKVDDKPTTNFIDAGNTYYTNYLATAKHMGIVSGVGDKKFAPDSKITRQDFVTILYNIMKATDEIPSYKNTSKFDKFNDVETIAGYAKEAMKSYVENGYIAGSNNVLNPNDYATRAEMAQLLYNILLLEK